MNDVNPDSQASAPFAELLPDPLPPLPASLEQSNVNTAPTGDAAAFQDPGFDQAAWLAQHAVEARQHQRLQIAALVLANNVGPNNNLALEAQRAVQAADALLDLLAKG